MVEELEDVVLDEDFADDRRWPLYTHSRSPERISALPTLPFRLSQRPTPGTARPRAITSLSHVGYTKDQHDYFPLFCTKSLSKGFVERIWSYYSNQGGRIECQTSVLFIKAVDRWPHILRTKASNDKADRNSPYTVSWARFYAPHFQSSAELSRSEALSRSISMKYSLKRPCKYLGGESSSLERRKG